MEGKPVTGIFFKASLGALKDLPISNVLYAYDTTADTTIMLEHKHAIYIGEHMEYSIVNTIQ